MKSSNHRPVKRLLIVATSCWLLTACAAAPLTYFVDAVNGRDEASGTSMEADGSKGPLRTLARVSRLPLLPGDQVLFKCGQTFEGPLRIKTIDHGGEGSLKLSSYGNCSPDTYPVITGLKKLGAGETTASGLTEWKVATPVDHMMADGKLIPVARYPARGYQIWAAEGEQPDGGAALRSWLPNKDLGGARVWVRNQDWLLEERKVSGRNGSAKLSEKFQYPIRKGVGIYLTGKPWMIGDGQGWAHDEDSQRLTARLPGGVRNVAIAPDEPLVEINGDSGISISQLHLSDAGGTALQINASAFVQVKDVFIERSGRNGMYINGSTYAVIENNTITDVGNDGILLIVRKGFVRNNTLRRIGLWGPPKSALAAINGHLAAKVVIENNLVDGAAYVGIRFSGDAQVRRNIVLRACQVLSDCGAIYTWRSGVNHVPPASEISHNTVVGVNGDTSVRYSMVDFFSGIYLDDYTRDVDVIDNMVVDAAQGIYVHNAVRNKVLGNRVIGTRNEKWQILLGIDPPRFPASEKLNNEVRDNELVMSFPNYKLPTDLSPLNDRVGLVDAGARKIALGWVNWRKVDWGKVAPGCRPANGSSSREAGDVASQPTAVMLDCFVPRP